MSRTTIAFVLCCLIYLLVAPSFPLEIGAALKIAPILVLSYLVVGTGFGPANIHLLLALLFSMAGDVLLELNHFVPGLSSFLLAQFLYGSLFLRYHSSWSSNSLRSFLFIGFSLVMAVVMWNSAGDMRIPVIAYLLVITFMGVSANTSSIKGLTIGAAIFILSDTIIAIERFVMKVPGADGLIMLTYYAAQFILVSAVLREFEAGKKSAE